MKRFLFTASAAAMLLAGCSDEMSDRYASGVDSGDLIRIYASISDETGANTRTSLGALTDTGFPYKWDDADAIGVFPVGEDGEAVPHTNAIFKYDAASKETGRTAFLGTPQILRYDNIWSYYPWSANTTVENGNIIELNIRPYQNYNFSAVPESAANTGNENGNLIPNGSFAQGEAPSVAWGRLSMSDDNSYTFDLEFFPLAGYLAIPVIGEGKVSSVSITVREGEGSNAKYVQLSGTLNIDMSAGVGSLGNPGFESGNGTYATVAGKPTPENGGKITVECGRGVQLDTEIPTWFWFVVPANMPTTNDTHVDIYVDGSKKFTYTFNRGAGKTEISRNMTLSLTDSQKAFKYTEGEEKDYSTIPEDMNIAFPDENFRKYVLDYFDKNKDGIISQEEALDVKEIVVPEIYFKLSSLEGIKYFKNLTFLNLRYLNLTSLDLRGCNALTELRMHANENLTSLDLRGCTALTTLWMNYNYSLTSLDLRGFNALTELNITFNKSLTSLDLRGCTALTTLWMNSNYSLTALDLSDCTALIDLYLEASHLLPSLDLSGHPALFELDIVSCHQLISLDLRGCNALTNLGMGDNTSLPSLDLRGCNALTGVGLNYNDSLTALNISDCTALVSLSCISNQLTDLDVSGCTALEYLYCDHNRLTDLDLSKNTALTTLECSSNQLTDLDVSNNIKLESLRCNMESLATLYLNTDQAIKGITYDRSPWNIHENTNIEYK